MRRIHGYALLCGVGVCCAEAPARAETLFSCSGQVALADGVAPDGVKVKLQVDLDRNGRLDSFETLTADVAADGSYALSYALNPKDVDLKLVAFVTKTVADYRARGFDALLDAGPLPVVLSFEREGYSSLVKRLNTLFETPSLDVTLAPLGDVQCAGEGCLSPDGGVRLSGFPGGTKIARAYADAYDPGQEQPRFPGLFTDSANNLLVSSGFAEINLYQADGSPVHELSEPITTRFEAKRASWSTLPDLTPNTGRIELPMYSFNQLSGEWVAEPDGELQDADGKVIPEDDLVLIHDGTYGKQLFVGFTTQHFSTFNCDAPIAVRACVKGTVVAKGSGKALAGVSVSVDGVSYAGTAGALVTGLDGTFAADVRKSELAGEDLDGNGKKGERLQAHVVATGSGVFIADAFETPTTQGSVGQASRPDCKPAACDCVDLGEIAIEFEEPRLCDVTVSALFSGNNVVGGDGPLLEGDAVVGAQVRAALAGGAQLPPGLVSAACSGHHCGPGLVPESGALSFSVPVVGEAPQVQLDASWTATIEGKLHYYSGSLVVDACARDQTALAAPIELQVDHSEVSGLGDFIASLGTGIKAPSGGLGGVEDPQNPLGPGCGCRQAGGGRESSSGLVLLTLALGAICGRRRQAPEK